MSEELPHGWAVSTLGGLFDFKYGKGLLRENRDGKGSVKVYGSNGVVGVHDKAVTRGPTIIVGRKGSVGEVHFSPEPCWPIDTAYFIDEFPPESPPAYWALYIKSLRLGQQEKSSAIPGISRDDVYDNEVPVPPLPEQRRIVAKLETLLGKVEASQQRLAKIPVLLKRFRQSVLAAACSGRLTADWREEEREIESAGDFVRRVQVERKAAYGLACAAAVKGERKPKPPKNEFTAVVDEDADGLPDGWCVARIVDISDCLDHIRVPINKAERVTRQGTIPYYGANGQVGVIDDFLFDEDLVLVVEDETFIGREIPFSYIIRGKSWVNNHAHVLRPLSGMPVDYLNISLSYYDFTPLTSGTTGRRKLNQEALINAPLWIAPLPEQQEIVRRVEGLFALADQLEVRLTKARGQVDALTPSLLARAFAGKLVPQDPKDEPAEKLLERIQAKPADQEGMSK